MNLTPLDIRRKEFDKVFRGYDPTEVNLFLKQAADRLEEIQEDARRTEEKTRDAEAKLVHYEKVELALQEALETARESARRSEASAEEKARLIVKEAELRAERIVHDAERERYGMRQDVSKLNARQSEIAARLRGFLFSELEVLAQFQGDDPVGFIKLQPAGGGPAPQASLPPATARLEAPISDMEDVPDREWEPPSDQDWQTDAAPADRPDPYATSPEEASPDDSGAEDDFDPAPWAFDSASPAEDAPAETAFADTAPPEMAPAEAAADASAPTDPPPPAPFVPLAPDPSASGAPDAPPEAYAPAEDPARPGSPLAGGPPTPRAVTGGWDLRSLVTGEERSVTASDEEREAIRRILDDLD